MKKISQKTHLIQQNIYFIRGRRVMLDYDLARLYGVETKVLNQSIKRNLERFPEDFMFRLSSVEFTNLRSQFVTSRYELPSNKLIMRSQSVTASKRNLKFSPYAFTEQGIAMLSSVLNSKQAIQVNIQIMRTFTKIREMLVSNKELREKIEQLEKKYDSQFSVVFDAIKLIISPEEQSSTKIGFRTK